MDSALKNDGILEANIPGVKAGRRTIYKRLEEEDSGGDLKDEIIVVDDFGANRGATQT